MTKYTLFIWTLMLGVLLLAACNTADTSQETNSTDSNETVAEKNDHEVEDHDLHDEDDHEEHAHGNETTARIAVGHENGIWILDSDHEEVVETLDLSVSALSLSPDQRHIFVNDRENGVVKLLDSGVWSEAHGDHAHDYIENPVLSSYELKGDQPTHFVNHAGRTAIFDDGSGEINVYEDTALTTEEAPVPVATIQTVPHHGVAVPLSDGRNIVSYTPEENPQPLPEGIAIYTTEGEKESTFSNCPGLHGEASGGSDETETVAFGCEGQVLLYHPAENDITELALPDEGARVGSLKGLSSSDYMIGNYSSEKDANLNTHVSLIDLKERTIETIDLGTEYVGSMAMDEEHAYVIGKNGSLFMIHLSTGEIESETAVIDPIAPSEGHGHGKPGPALALVEGIVYITDPATMTLNQVDPVHGETEVIQTFDAAPTSVIAIKKGTAHDH
ncbi:hypothetical protein [Jeotgalibacillus haloalkalitolerans]|uniref:Uncharacterized protein n=1 Tax=Jeotgalibacillus haloalkalitolerans TaxID=3104292 RepID=A0ABU5KIS7_9BACL|nr:hypothetical protein [Jeotgalibacillus sp. HH7-29]MDZ5711028.1 hypothetical protein [Jeotgalibacillus sp. HH7-29]